MANSYSATKHLYTLNDSVAMFSSRRTARRNFPMKIHSKTRRLGQILRTCKDKKKSIFSSYVRLIRKNEEYQKTIAELHLKNQELVELNQLAEVRNVKHEEKQRDLIRRLSYFQVGNKQLNGDIKRLQQY